MWKQKFRGRGKENHQIGAPVLINTTYDKGLLKSAHERHDVGLNGQRLPTALASHLPRPLSEAPSSFYSQPTPQLPPNNWLPQTPHMSVAPSSVYSQVTPGLPPIDWSPPTPQGNYQEYDVSPVDDTPGPFSHARGPSAETPQPNSRFSWTTHATDTTYQFSPPSSPPAMPNKYQYEFATPSARDQRLSSAPAPLPAPEPFALFDRRSFAPSIASTSTAKATTRKPVAAPSTSTTINPPKQRGAQTTLAQAARLPPTHQRSATAPVPSINKTLPQPPTLQETLTAGDHIAALDVRLDDLALRRKNISRVIHDLTTARPVNNPLVTTLAERREAEQTIKGLEAELAEIGHEEHDLGMRMHRARKRREREEGGVGVDAIWIKRVTSGGI